MILYNVTVNIDHSENEEWLKWMKEVHIPNVMDTGMFVENRICKLIGDEDSGGVTYSIQYVCNSMKDYEKYRDTFAHDLQAEHATKYKNKFVAFRTLLEIL